MQLQHLGAQHVRGAAGRRAAPRSLWRQPPARAQAALLPGAGVGRAAGEGHLYLFIYREEEVFHGVVRAAVCVCCCFSWCGCIVVLYIPSTTILHHRTRPSRCCSPLGPSPWRWLQPTPRRRRRTGSREGPSWCLCSSWWVACSLVWCSPQEATHDPADFLSPDIFIF